MRLRRARSPRRESALFALAIGLTVDLDFENGFHFSGLAGAGLEAQGSIRGFERAGVASQLGKDGEQPLLDPPFGQALIDGMQDRPETERALESVVNFHR